ncbi:hypothetical protein N7456_007238 [Penicillium angulare]|uniref:Zn(2)-C6 fungal-type domain-containing protein n=1 Tax=Penicillium angulare TaxID=116970 RepID=A0A9W9FJ65_9EURO|nr:hypothetical protein N7456_007238 [Penicillium angulare]
MPVAVETMATTPNSQSAMDSASNADKKRNKLGYHRTSVACVHCRRRKIRCLVAPDDAQGRCENCIRLRKECQFFPVDQQPPIEKKSRPSSRLETQPTDPTATTPISSSPTNLNPESVDAFYSYPQMPLNASSSAQDMSGFNPAAFAGHPMSGFTPDRSMGTGEYSAHPTMETGVPWDEFTTISDPQMLATMAANKNQMMNLSPNVWTPGSSVPSGLPPSSPMSGASQMSGHTQPMNTPTYAMQPDGTVWQVPPPPQPSRAMSYPGQAMSPTYPPQFQPQMPPDLKRRMTTPAQSLSAPNVGTHTSPASTPDMPSAPGSVPYSAQSGMDYQQWPMNMPPNMGVVPYPMYTNEPVPQPFTTNPPPMGHPGATGHSGS